MKIRNTYSVYILNCECSLKEFHERWTTLTKLRMRAFGGLNAVSSRPITTILRINENNSVPSQPV